MEVYLLSKEKQAELISEACRMAGLDGHTIWIETKEDAYSWSERIADKFRGRRKLPVKTSTMYCENLEMCFFYDENGHPMVTYAGHLTIDSSDLKDEKIQNTFAKAKQVMSYMETLAWAHSDDEEKEEAKK